MGALWSSSLPSPPRPWVSMHAHASPCKLKIYSSPCKPNSEHMHSHAPPLLAPSSCLASLGALGSLATFSFFSRGALGSFTLRASIWGTVSSACKAEIRSARPRVRLSSMCEWDGSWGPWADILNAGYTGDGEIRALRRRVRLACMGWSGVPVDWHRYAASPCLEEMNERSGSKKIANLQSGVESITRSQTRHLAV